MSISTIGMEPEFSSEDYLLLWEVVVDIVQFPDFLEVPLQPVLSVV